MWHTVALAALQGFLATQTPDEHFWALVQQVVFLPLRALQRDWPLSHSGEDVRGCWLC